MLYKFVYNMWTLCILFRKEQKHGVINNISTLFFSLYKLGYI